MRPFDDIEPKETFEPDPDDLIEREIGVPYLCHRCGMTWDYDKLVMEQIPGLRFTHSCPRCHGDVDRL